jgi:hypothetical protein
MMRSTSLDSRWGPRSAAAVMAALLAVLAPWGAARPIERPRGLAEMVGQAAVVVHAEVLGVSSSYLDTPLGKAPFIIYQARAKTVLLGPGPAEFTIVLPGLVNSGRIVADPDSPSPRVGAQYVVFLRPAPGAPPEGRRFMLTGGADWVLPIMPGGDPQDPPVSVPTNPPPGPSGPARVLIKLSGLAGQIQAIAANRADHQP